MEKIGFLPALSLIFTAAKLFGAISWSWWLVFAPMWVPLTIGLGSIALIAIFILISAIITGFMDK